MLLGALLGSGCAPRPTLTLSYRVDLAARRGDAVPVTLQIDGARGDSVVLDGDAPASLMRLDDVHAAPKGAGVAGGVLDIDVTSRQDGESAPAYPVVVVRHPPGRTRIMVSYVVHLGTRDGNAHTGFTGRAAGFAGDRYAFATGRSLFLTPHDSRRVGHVGVAFVLPAGWSAVTPWPVDSTHPAAGASATFAPGVAGASPVQDLVWAPLGFGRFTERQETIAGTRFRFAVEAGIGGAMADSTVATLTAIARTVTRAMGRGLGAEFTTVVVPENPNGDEAMAEGWVDGYGGTLAPLTTARAHDFADDLVSAYVQPGPLATTVREARERWLAAGVAGVLPWRALETVGLSRREDLVRRLSVDFAKPFEDSDTSGVHWDLERLGPTPVAGESYARDVLAPLALLRLDETLGAATGGRASLDDVLPRLFGTRVAPSLWTALPDAGDARWNAFRTRYVAGKAWLHGDSLLTPQPPITDTPVVTTRRVTFPTKPSGEPGTLILAVTGDTYGYLENCGCTVNQAGGVARRATLFERLRREGPFVALDAGNALARPEHYEPPDSLARQEERLYLRTMGQTGYPVGAVGPAELAYGLDRFRQAAAAATFPFVLANARAASGPLAAPWKIVRVGAVRLAVVGLTEPGSGPWANDVLERHLGRAVTFDDPVAVLARLMPTLRAQSDLVVAMGNLSPLTVRRLARDLPDLDVVISTDDQQGAVSDSEWGTITTSDQQGFIGRTLVMYTNMSSFGVSGATLQLDATRRIVGADLFAHWLGDSIPDDPKIRVELTHFYDTIGRAAAGQAKVPPLFAADAHRIAGPYAGAARCQTCHGQEYAQWKSTAHAGAMKTLLDVHRNYQPRCVVCHVVGFSTPTGYKLGDSTDHLANVQCEICHGPGAAHAASPTRSNITRQVPAAVCAQCHTPDHSVGFVYADKLPRVVHR